MKNGMVNQTVKRTFQTEEIGISKSFDRGSSWIISIGVSMFSLRPIGQRYGIVDALFTTVSYSVRMLNEGKRRRSASDAPNTDSRTETQ